MLLLGFPGGTNGKETICQCRRHKRRRSDPWVRKIPWGKTWQPTPVFLPREPHGQRSLAGYRLWGCREPPWAMNSMTQSCKLPPVMPELVVAPQSQRTGCPSHRFFPWPLPLHWKWEHYILPWPLSHSKYKWPFSHTDHLIPRLWLWPSLSIRPSASGH